MLTTMKRRGSLGITRQTNRWTLLVLGVVSPLLASCASLPELPWAPVARDATAGFYDTARLEYKLDAGKLGQPLDVVRVDGRRVAYEQIASSPVADQSTGTLVIQYPHPAGRDGFARVTFAIDSQASETQVTPVSLNPFAAAKPPVPPIGHYEEIHEVWAMDLPRSESDRYFKLLSAQNFYAGDAPDKGSAQLAVHINGRELRKNWEQLPELNELARRVRSQGQLVAYLRPAAAGGEPIATITSTRAYRELLARTSGPAAAGRSAIAGSAEPPSAPRRGWPMPFNNPPASLTGGGASRRHFPPRCRWLACKASPSKPE